MNDKLSELTKEELLDLLNAYDEYIQMANDEDYYKMGWFPVCIQEFYDNEYMETDEPYISQLEIDREESIVLDLDCGADKYVNKIEKNSMYGKFNK